MALAKKANRRRADADEVKEARKSAFLRYGGAFVHVSLALGLAAGLGFGGFHLHHWAVTSPTFALGTVHVQGNARAESPELFRLAGLARGQNLFRMDPIALARAMSAHPWVKRVEVTRRFPSSLTVEIVEHQPVALLSLSDLYLLSAEGEPFKRVTAGDSLDLPLLTGLSREAYAADPEGSSKQIREALSVVAAYEASDAARGHPLSELRLGGQGPVLVTRDGQELRLAKDDVDGQLHRLARVRSELRQRGLLAEVIHLDNRARKEWVAVKVSANPSERREGPAQ